MNHILDVLEGGVMTTRKFFTIAVAVLGPVAIALIGIFGTLGHGQYVLGVTTLLLLQIIAFSVIRIGYPE